MDIRGILQGHFEQDFSSFVEAMPGVELISCYVAGTSRGSPFDAFLMDARNCDSEQFLRRAWHVIMNMEPPFTIVVRLNDLRVETQYYHVRKYRVQPSVDQGLVITKHWQSPKIIPRGRKAV